MKSLGRYESKLSAFASPEINPSLGGHHIWASTMLTFCISPHLIKPLCKILDEFAENKLKSLILNIEGSITQTDRQYGPT